MQMYLLFSHYEITQLSEHYWQDEVLQAMKANEIRWLIDFILLSEILKNVINDKLK